MSRLPLPITLFATAWIVGCAATTPPVALPPPPPRLDPSADATTLIDAVNRTAAIHSLSTNSAKLDITSMPALPKLSANIHLERPKNFRLKAAIPLVMGSGIDLGSNQREFWFEVPEGARLRPTLYRANHAEYSRMLDRAVLPVDPSWLIDAMGLGQLDANRFVVPPLRRSDGQWEVRTVRPSPVGNYEQVAFIEPTAGYVTYLYLYAPDRRQIATSVLTDHRYDAASGVALPHRVDITLQPAGEEPLSMRIEVKDWAINQMLSGDPNLFNVPAGNPNQVDLVRLGQFVPAATPSGYRVARGTESLSR